MIISISVEGYRSKPSDIPSIKYVMKDLQIDEIADKIANGHAISANFTNNETDHVTQTQRTYANFVSTCFVMLDLDDDVTETLQELNEDLCMKPTISYTTYSHQQKGKGNRYRLLYFFNQPIENSEVYKKIYDNILTVNDFNLKDNCGRNCTQNVFGTYHANISNFSLINSRKIYDISDFVKNSKSDITTYKRKRGESIMECNGTFTDTSREYVISDSSFLIDYENLKIGDIIKKYVGRYENIEETPMDNPNEDEAYILYPKDYICIRRRWFPFEVLDEKSNVRTKVTKIRRIKDGEGRRHKLFINGVIRRLITNDTISFDNLLFNLLHEFHCYYEHKDIGKEDIMQVARNVWKADLKRYEGLRGAEHQFRVNPLYCTKYGVSKKQAKQKAAKQLKNQKIGELYDFLLTDKENVEEFKKYGVNISIRTLKRWRKENGMTKYEKPNNTVVATEVIDMDSFLDSPQAI